MSGPNKEYSPEELKEFLSKARAEEEEELPGQITLEKLHSLIGDVKPIAIFSYGGRNFCTFVEDYGNGKGGDLEIDATLREIYEFFKIPFKSKNIFSRMWNFIRYGHIVKKRAAEKGKKTLQAWREKDKKRNPQKYDRGRKLRDLYAASVPPDKLDSILQQLESMKKDRK